MSSWTTVAGVQLEMVERGGGRPILWLHGEEGLDPDAPVLGALAAEARMGYSLGWEYVVAGFGANANR